MTGSTRTRPRTDQNSSTGPKKRVKVEHDAGDALSAAAPGIPERSKDLWLEDGNVIIAARDMAFRVHASVLVRRSEVFKVLLGGTALAQLREKYERCPVLRVEDDSRVLHDMLQVLYDGGNSDWLNSKRPPIPYAEFRALAAIALKYQVKEIIDEAVFRLSRMFPTDDMYSWDPNLEPDGANTPITMDDADCIDALRLARLLGMHASLPLVFYACCDLLAPADLLAGVHFPGAPEPVRLSDADLRTVLDALDTLQAASARKWRALPELAAMFSSAPPPGCTARVQCRRAFDTLSFAAIDAGLYRDCGPVDPADWWLENEQTRLGVRMCKACGEKLRKTIDERREEVWQKLGTIFGVEDWPAGQPEVSVPLKLSFTRFLSPCSPITVQ
ncbi:hypothetical protein PsYK624_046420 [Phanerochaete sordida]|uniref:BTB domain-containing protein n=1 Tax=Phanerochaete sordida TaxID=48140 RepID=A0A9P3G641_9APHY|nr:hypothetical protein PsYK624_046420 [Phanerochaete sordida]